ncbi:MAG: helicase [Ponticaulis sp.]|nr:helicase [Ponticaulis sp.]
MSKLIAVLGPTNTGKTHYALERMLAYRSGMIGLPLRLLAREIYDKVVEKKGEAAVALVTGEERIWPESARYFICTVEAMPMSREVDFMAVDEIQLATDPDRGHVFTHRILNARGLHETLLLGSEPMREVLFELGLDVDTNHRERFSELMYVGPRKITKLPKRSAIVAFSADEVYAIAELLKRQRGGAAVVMGALSPRTRNAQVDLYQSGEVDYLVATDAIGMGLNLDVEHIAFASRSKFDGRRRRQLTPAEAGQIAGRAGRFRTDGTFGETGDCPPFEDDTVIRIETHNFESVQQIQWRNYELSYRSIERLLQTLTKPSGSPILRHTPDALDEATLRRMAMDTDVTTATTTGARVKRLWDLCCLPDFRRTGVEGHLRVVQALWSQLHDPDARLSCEWMERALSRLRSTEGDIDVLQTRLAAIRTWTYAANRSDWVQNAEIWRGQTREIEDLLSDALHERLTLRFVDKRTTALMRGLSREDAMEAGFGDNGEITVEGHVVGHLEGLVFRPVTQANTVEGKAVRTAAMMALKPILSKRLSDIATTHNHAFSMNDYGQILFNEHPVARLVKGPDWMMPRAELIGAEDAAVEERERARDRAELWLHETTLKLLPALTALRKQLNDVDLPGAARGLAFRVLESGSAVDLREDDPPVRLNAEEREALKGWGIRTGRVAAYAPETTKPAQQAHIARLFSVFNSTDVMIAPTGAGSFAIEEGWSDGALHSQGYLRFGPRAIRADLAERLAWEIDKRRKEAGKNQFEIPADLASVVSCPGEAFVEVLKAYGLAPAEHDAETQTVKSWRFKARANPDGRPPRRPRRGPPTESAKEGGARPPRGKSKDFKPGNRPPRRDDRNVAKAKAAERAEKRKNDPDNPFAALASLLPPEPPPKPKKKKKKPGKKPATGEAVAENTAVEGSNPEAVTPESSHGPETETRPAVESPVSETEGLATPAEGSEKPETKTEEAVATADKDSDSSTSGDTPR